MSNEANSKEVILELISASEHSKDILENFAKLRTGSAHHKLEEAIQWIDDAVFEARNFLQNYQDLELPIRATAEKESVDFGLPPKNQDWHHVAITSTGRKAIAVHTRNYKPGLETVASWTTHHATLADALQDATRISREDPIDFYIYVNGRRHYFDFSEKEYNQ